MITANLLEKQEEYITPTPEDLKEEATFTKSRLSETSIFESREFKRSLVRNQWKYVKENYKNNPISRNIIQLGDWYALQNNHKRAMYFYLEALNLEKENVGIYNKIIKLLTTHQQFKEAEPYFKTLMAISNKYEVLKSYIFFRTAAIKEYPNVKDVIKLIEEALSQKPEDFELISLQGFLLLNILGDVLGAKKIFEKCLKINKNYIHAINNLGVCYLREGNYSTSAEYLKKAISIDPYSYPFSYQNLTNVYLAQNKNKEALQLLDEAYSKHILLGDTYLHTFAYLLLLDMQTQRAKIIYQELIRKEPNNNLVYNNLGVCYSREKNPDEALIHFNKSILQCKNQLKKGLLKDSRSLHAWYNTARVATFKGDWNTVDRISKEILSLSKEDPYGLYFKGSYLVNKEKYDEAADCFERVLKITKDVPELYATYSFVLASIKRNYKETINLLEEALRLGYKDSFIINNLAFAYIKSNDLARGRTLLKDYEDSDLGILVATRGLLEIRSGNLNLGNKFYKKSFDILKGKIKTIAQQIWNYELSYYWYTKKDFKLAKEYLDKAKEFGETYLSLDIKELGEKINYQ